MQLTGRITVENLMSLEAYSHYRQAHKAELMVHRQRRTVQLGPHMSLQFESETTIRYQIQEMLRIEKIFEQAEIQQEIDAYASLVPDGSNWKATLFLAYPDADERRQALVRLIGVEDRMYIEVQGLPRVYAAADEDLVRENDEKTSAVHFVRFEFDAPTKAAIQARQSVTLGCDHPHYSMSTPMPASCLMSLLDDLK